MSNTGYTNNDIIVYQNSDSFNVANKTEVTHVNYRVHAPISAKSLLNGQMPTGGVDTIIAASGNIIEFSIDHPYNAGTSTNTNQENNDTSNTSGE